VSVTLGFQELPQLEADYGKVGMQKIITTVGNVVSGSAPLERDTGMAVE
jgi:type IV secretory pathway TraG/TraD family ATPase VirD4